MRSSIGTFVDAIPASRVHRGRIPDDADAKARLAQAIEEREKKLALIQWTERAAAEEIYCGGILHA
jgi:hypothetical protein